MPTSPNMNLNIPVVSETLGPEWAELLNACLAVIDAHNHTSESGVKVPTSGLNINAALDFNKFKATNLNSTQFRADLAAALTGASNAGSLSMFGGNLYFTNGSGVSVQLTTGATPVTVPGTFSNLSVTSVAGDLAINNSDTFVQINVDTTSSRTITLPAASSVAVGRIYVVVDFSYLSNTNPITINCTGGDTFTDGSTSLVVQSNGASLWLSGDGASKWAAI